MKLWDKFKSTAFCKGWIKLINDLKPMTFKQRVDHLWSYYKAYLIIVAMVVMFIGFFVTVIDHRSKTPLVSGMMINMTMTQDGHNYLMEDYQKLLSPDDKNKIVELDYTYFGDLNDPDNGDASYYAAMTFIARVSGQLIDYAMMDKFAMEFYLSQDVYLDLREFFTAEELATLDAENRLIYLQIQDEGEEPGERFPVAVDITELPFIKDTVTSEGPIYFTLSGHIRNLDMCRNAWDRLHAWESKPAQ